MVDRMLGGRDDVREAMFRNQVRLVVMASTEMTTDVPEQRDMTPKDYWDRRARGATRRSKNLLPLRGREDAEHLAIFRHSSPGDLDPLPLLQ